MHKVLVLDEDPLVLKMLNKALTLLGYAPHITQHPDEAVALLQAHSFDAVIAEVFLASGNGLNVLRQFKEQEPQVYVVALTGSSGTAEANASLEAIRQHGADYVLRKPVEMQQLENSLAAIPRPGPVAP